MGKFLVFLAVMARELIARGEAVDAHAEVATQDVPGEVSAEVLPRKGKRG